MLSKGNQLKNMSNTKVAKLSYIEVDFFGKSIPVGDNIFLEYTYL